MEHPGRGKPRNERVGCGGMRGNRRIRGGHPARSGMPAEWFVAGELGSGMACRIVEEVDYASSWGEYSGSAARRAASTGHRIDDGYTVVGFGAVSGITYTPNKCSNIEEAPWIPCVL